MKLSELLIGAAVGAGLMYLFDARPGTPNRVQPTEAKAQPVDRLNEARQDVQQLFKTVTAEVTAQGSSDAALCERVRVAIVGRVSYGSAIHVEVVDGRATLRGPILLPDLLPVLSAARGVPGVTSVDSQLDTHPTSANMPEFHDLPARSLPSL